MDNAHECFKKNKSQRMLLRFYIQYKVGEAIIDSIPHSHTENALKRSKTKKYGLVYI